MIVSRISPLPPNSALKFATVFCAVLGTLAADIAYAQAIDQGSASQGPRVLSPTLQGSASAPLPGQANTNAASAQSNDLPSLPAPVAVGDLGTVEGPAAGTLNDFNGGLGREMWSGSSRADAEMFLQRIPVVLPSPTARLLFRKALLTEAPLPVGAGTRPFNALRIQRLLEAGALEDAGALAALVRSRDTETQRMQADAMLYAGRDIEVCGDATSNRLQSAEAFWVALRAYCYHFDGDASALELTRTVMETAGIADPAFLHLLDAFDEEEPTPPEAIATPNALHIRLLVRHGLPIPANAIAALGMPTSIIAAMSAETMPEIRRSAAERAFRIGALPAPVMQDIFANSEFDLGDPRLAATLARSEPMMMALERIYRAFPMDDNASRRAEMVHLSFQIGYNEGLFLQTAQLFANEAAGIIPAPNWEAWSPLMVRGLLLSATNEAADRWYNMLNPLIPAHYEAWKDTTLVMSIVRRDEPYVGAAQDALEQLAMEALDPIAAQNLRARTALILGLFDALGMDMPPDARAQVEPLVATDFPGRSPAPVIMQRIDSASLGGRRAELGLAVLEAIGPRGASDMAPNVIVRFVRALQTAGMAETARALAGEAILTWQGG
jgi:hypothetical protein